jgi:hypothetical protein
MGLLTGIVHGSLQSFRPALKPKANVRLRESGAFRFGNEREW